MVLATLLVQAGSPGIATTPNPPASNSSQSNFISSKLAQQPLSFEPNEGQFDPQVKYLARGKNYNLFLTGNEAVFGLNKPQPATQSVSVEQLANSKEGPAQATPQEADPTPPPVGIRMAFKGGNAQPRLEYSDELPGKTNYFFGNDPALWRSNVASYSRVYYRGVYPGIDLVFYGNESQLEYDWVVGAGVDPALIELGFEGASGLELNAQGELVLHTANGDLTQHVPQLYQTINGQKKAVGGHYELTASQQGGLPVVSFGIAEYDQNQPLIIDPSLVYSTYLGGNGTDSTYSIAVDGAGNALVTGGTDSTNFPTTLNAYHTTNSGGTEAFVTKLNATGTIVYSTYLGGAGSESGNDIAVDSSGNAFVTGYTTSTNFPTALGAYQSTYGGGNFDAFITKLNQAGGLVYSTYLGGSDGDSAYGVAVDSSGNAFVTGSTFSANFPTTLNSYHSTNSGGNDAFITKLNPAGTALVYSTYLGGSSSEGGKDIAVDNSGNAFVTGSTFSANFPTTLNSYHSTNSGGKDAFITKLNPAGTALVYSTYLGGNQSDTGSGITVDSSGNAFVTGYTFSTNFPTLGAYQPTNGGNSDAFVTKLNPAGSALVYSTYLGGSSYDYGNNIAVDSSGNAFVIGYAFSTNFPTTLNAYQPTSGGDSDAFVTEFNPAGTALVYSTYLGGSSAEFGHGIAVDSSGNIFVTGETSSTNFPTLVPSQNTNAGGYDTFIAKFTKQAQNPQNIVTVALDNGSGTTGTLSFVLANATTANGGTITFAPGITTITFSTGHAPLPALNPGVALQGVCGNSGPQIIIDGTGVSGTGLTLGGNNQVTGIAIKKFGGTQIAANTTGGNQLYCVKANKQ